MKRTTLFKLAVGLLVLLPTQPVYAAVAVAVAPVLRNAASGDSLVNHDIFVTHAETERLRAMGENMVKVTESDLQFARAEYVRTQDYQLRRKVELIESLVAALHADISPLKAVHFSTL